MAATPASPAQRAEMERNIAELKLRMERAETYAAYLKGKLWNSEVEKGQMHNIARERTRFHTWSTAWRQWALDGWNPQEQLAYPVSFWQRIGKDIDGALLSYSAGYSAPGAPPLVFADPGSIPNVVVTVGKETVSQVATPSLWPPWLKGALGLGAVGVGVIIILNVATIVRGLKGGAS